MVVKKVIQTSRELKGTYEGALLGLLVLGEVCWHPGTQPSWEMGVKHWKGLLLFCFISSNTFCLRLLERMNQGLLTDADFP